MRNLFFSFTVGLFLVAFSGCGSSDEATTVTVQAPYEAGAYVVFDSANGDIPYPNNILFAGSTDGTLNIPVDPSSSDAPIKEALNTLDGFSTSSPISVSFNGDINASTLISGLKVYEIDAVASEKTGGVPLITSIKQELHFMRDYVTTVSGNKIVILPIRPLKSHQNYMVILTKGITDNNANPIAPDVASELLLQTSPLIDQNGNHTALSVEDATKLEAIRQLTQAMIGYAVAQGGLNQEDIVAAWSFQTQTIGAVATAFSDANISAKMEIADTKYTSKDMIGSPYMKGNAEVYAGVLKEVPYYLAAATNTHDTAPLTKSFVFENASSLPEQNATLTIPVLVTVPKGITMPANGWPVVIFQHGITQNRTNLLAISEALASVGYAAVAIDLPLHGIADSTNPLYMGDLERTFNLDLINNDTSAPGPDGKIDPSGTHYINLASLLTSRDNMRQTTSDLIALKNSFGNVVAQDGTKFDASQVAFVGHSLGTMAPFGFFAHADLESVTLAMPGGGIAELLNNSAAFGPLIEAGLAQKGVIKGTAAYAAFMLSTQTILDDADPINYAMEVGVKQKIFAIEVVGDEATGNLPDQVIPNNVPTAPLSGTDPLVNYLQAETLVGNTRDVIAPNKTARYNVGNHSSILDPTESPEATASMQTQTAFFVSTKGEFILIYDENLLNMDY